MAANVMPIPVDALAAESAADDDPVPEPTADEMEEARQPLPPVALAAGATTHSFELRADSKALFQEVAKVYGLDVIFDGDYRATQAVRFHVDNAGYADALYALEAATGSFIVPIGPRLFMVVNDTQAKRTEQETAVAVTIPIPDPVSVQEAQELARAVQQIMEVPKFAIDSTQRLVFMRGPVSKVEPARALFTQLMTQRPQVYIEVDILTVAKSTSRSLGVSPQTTFQLLSEGTRALTAIGAPFSYLRIGITGAQLFANATTSQTRSILHSELRTVDAQPVTFHVGDKYPIVTTLLSPLGTGGSQGGYTPPPLFNFEDLGLSMKVTPKVHSGKELTLDLEAEFKALGAEGVNGLPIISNRKFAERVRLNFGEYAIVAGLLSANEARTIGGFAGLTDVPVLSPLLSLHTKTKDEAEVLVIIKPHLVDAPPSEFATREIWTGSESRPRIPL
jgi:type II secretory pathway component GspD/PulD (secretin)